MRYTLVLFILLSFSNAIYAQCCGDGVCDPGETELDCPFDCAVNTPNCTNTIGSFSVSPSFPVNYSTANANGWCYTVTGPFPKEVCFEYIVPPAGVDASVSISISGCNTTTINQANLLGGGCNTNNTISSDITASATYDGDCNQISSGITTGGGNCYNPGDIITICYTVTGTCGDVEICPVISCGSEDCPNEPVQSICPPFNFTMSTFIDPCVNGMNSGTAVVTPDCGSHFTYLWDDPLSQTDSLAIGLNPGVYNVVVTNTAFMCDTTYTLVVDTIIPSFSLNQVAEICQGDSIFLSNDFQTVSGIYNDTLLSVHGCDSIIVTNLTVLPLATSVDTQTACDSYLWIDGVTYTSSTNTPIFVIAGGAANGCDSIVTLDLVINSNEIGIDIQSACESFTWIDGVTYISSTNSPTYTISGGATNGCDSTVNLNLTINSTNFGTDFQTACESFTWIDGITYASSTNTPAYTILGGGTNGCDSIVTLNLTINTPSTITNIYNECEGYSVTVGTNTYSSSGIYTDINNFCDTIITNLTIHPYPQVTLIKGDENCQDENGYITAIVNSNNPPITYQWNTGSIDAELQDLSSGTYSVVISDASGCSVEEFISIFQTNIDCGYFVYIPTGFSPNGDLNNDVLFVRGKGISSFTLNIYNRWGNRVFVSEDLEIGWDGTYKGEPQNSATFVYTIKGTFANGQTFQQSGDISLIR